MKTRYFVIKLGRLLEACLVDLSFVFNTLSAPSHLARKAFLVRSLASFFLASVFMASCSSQPSVSFDFECPEKRLVQLSLIDLSSSGRAKDILDERLKTIQSDIERVTDCEGTFSLVAWSVSSASSFRVFQGTLSTSGATEIGRDRKISRAVATTMAEVRAGITEAFEKVDPVGSDLFGAFSLAEEQAKSLGQDEQLEISILTDAITNVSPGSINRSDLTEAKVIEIAQISSRINLRDLKVKMVGIGKTGIEATQPPQDYVLLVKTYARAMCENTGAKCSIQTLIIG